MTYCSTVAVLILAIFGSVAQYVAAPNYQYTIPQGGNYQVSNTQYVAPHVGRSTQYVAPQYALYEQGGSQRYAISGGNTQVGGYSSDAYAIYGQGGVQRSIIGQTTVGGASGGRYVTSPNVNRNVYPVYTNQISYRVGLPIWTIPRQPCPPNRGPCSNNVFLLRHCDVCRRQSPVPLNYNYV